MNMTPLRDNVALAIDGGGIKGLIISRALMALEKELGGEPLIKHPQIKILAGTSTGSVIAAGIALGMKAEEIANLYADLGQHVFPPLVPTWLPKVVVDADKIIRLLFKHSLYSSKSAINEFKKAIQERTGNEDLTLGELNDRLGPDKVLILTTVNINERQTHFLKSYKDNYSDWKLWEALMASASAPIALPVLKHPDPEGKIAYYTDGGVGNYGNPAYFATQEAIVFRGFAPEEVSVLSFGTGWLSGDNYQKANGVPTSWRALNWAMNAPLLFVGDTARAQSVNIIQDYMSRGLDFRRFQFTLEKDIDSDAYNSDETYALMKQLGDQLGERVLQDQFAPNEDTQYDPEGLQETVTRYREAQQEAKAALAH